MSAAEPSGTVRPQDGGTGGSGGGATDVPERDDSGSRQAAPNDATGGGRADQHAETARERARRRRAARHAADEFAPHQWIYRNLTPWRIHASFREDGELIRTNADTEPCDAAARDCPVAKVLAIPALGEVVVPHSDARDLNTLRLRRLGQVELRPAPSEWWSSLPLVVLIFGWLAVALVFGAWALFGGGGSGLPWEFLLVSIVVVPLASLATASVREGRLYQRFSRYRKEMTRLGEQDDEELFSLEGVARSSRIRTFVDGVPRHVAELILLVGVLAISVVGLGVAIHLTTQLNDLLPIDYGALVRFDDPFGEVSDLARDSLAFWQLLVGHVTQWVLVSIAALTPAAMYFQFDRQRLASVQRQWIHEVFRLDPTVRTVQDISAKYGSQIESSFGVLSPDSTLRLRGGRRSPVIVATILLVVGWFLVISTTQVPALEPSTSDGVTTFVWPTAAGGETATTFPVANFFRPDLTLVGYAFLGAYVFTLFHVIRGYQRRDLHPRTYNTIVVRILAAYAMALVVGVVYDGPWAQVLMFFVGFMPQSALVWLREQLAQDKGIWSALPLHEPAPLTDLEGIDLYDRTRLAEEGINNVEGLAHADIVELMSSTRICAAQLVDWTDQAILYLRVGGDSIAQVRHEKTLLQKMSAALHHGKDQAAGADSAVESMDGPVDAATAGVAPTGGRAGAPGDVAGATSRGAQAATSDPVAVDVSVPAVRRNLCHLRSYGIRTATDLLQAYHHALQRGGDDEAKQAEEVRALRDALELRVAPDPKIRSIQTIIDTLPDEEWFMQVRNWRHTEFGAMDAWYWYLDGVDWEPQRLELPARMTTAMQPLANVPMADTGPQAAAAAPTSSGNGSAGSRPTDPEPATA